MLSMLPQLIHIVRKKQTEAMSHWVSLILLLGVGGWVWYGILKEDWIILVSNSISFAINLLIIILSWKYSNHKIGY